MRVGIVGSARCIELIEKRSIPGHELVGILAGEELSAVVSEIHESGVDAVIIKPPSNHSGQELCEGLAVTGFRGPIQVYSRNSPSKLDASYNGAPPYSLVGINP